MNKTNQNNLYKYIISNTEIDEIQCRYIAYKLENYNVKTITLIEPIKTFHFNFYTDNGSYKVKTVNLPLPISSVVRN